MEKIPPIIRSIALVCLSALVFAVGGLGMTDGSNPVLLLLALATMLYYFMELCAIIYRFIRYRVVDDAEKQLKWVLYQQNHQIEFKVVAVLRRFALAGCIALVVSVFVKHLSSDLLTSVEWKGWSPTAVALGFMRSSLIMLPLLLIMTFVKSWYIMHTNWEGADSSFTIFYKYLSRDFSVPGEFAQRILYAAAIALAVGSVLVI